MFKTVGEIHEADERHSNFRTPDLQRVTLTHHHSDVADIELRPDAPASVRAIFDRARNAYLYTWFDYDLGGAAELLAFGALEQALKSHFGEPLEGGVGLKGLYRCAVDKGLFPADPPNVWASTAKLVADVRNNWAHGSDHIHTPSMVIGVLRMCADRINALFNPSAATEAAAPALEAS